MTQDVADNSPSKFDGPLSVVLANIPAATLRSRLTVLAFLFDVLGFGYRYPLKSSE